MTTNATTTADKTEPSPNKTPEPSLTRAVVPPPDKLKNLVQLAAGWINSADTKATALLSMNGTILALAGTGFVFAQKNDGHGKVIPAVLMALFGLGVIVSILFAALTIRPRLDRKCILKKKGFTVGPSPTYFVELADLNRDEFIARICVNESEYAMDSLEQSVIICHIASTKMRTLQVAVWALVTGLIFLVAAIYVAVFGNS